MSNQTEDEKAQPIIVKKIIKKGGGHHGGAWKVAYADFVTAMMAFFLLMWLLNVTTAEEKFAISNFFDPTFPKVSSTDSGAGGVMGGTTVSPDGAQTSTVQPISQPDIPDTTKQGGDNEKSVIQKPNDGATDEETSEEQAREVIKAAEEERFKAVENQIRQAVESNEDLKALTNNLIIDMTEEGLRIQIVDQDNNAMFPSGSAQMFTKTRDLMKLVGQTITKLSNPISVRGHTDAAPYPAGNRYDNWELSADRANASRRALLDGGVPPVRLANVLGKAATDPIDTANPLAPINRRISIILLREKPTEQEVKKVQQRTEARAKLRAEQLEKEKAEIERKRIEEIRNRPFRSGGGVLGLE